MGNALEQFHRCFDHATVAPTNPELRHVGGLPLQNDLVICHLCLQLVDRLRSRDIDGGAAELYTPINRLAAFVFDANKENIGKYGLDETGGEIIDNKTGKMAKKIVRIAATVEVIERVLITQVTTRPLTLEEIRQKGILFGDDIPYLNTSFDLIHTKLAEITEAEKKQILWKNAARLFKIR